MPFMMTADEAARRILKALARRRKVFNFPWITTRMMRITRWFPDWLVYRIFKGYTSDRPMPPA